MTPPFNISGIIPEMRKSSCILFLSALHKKGGFKMRHANHCVLSEVATSWINGELLGDMHLSARFHCSGVSNIVQNTWSIFNMLLTHCVPLGYNKQGRYVNLHT